MTNRVELRNASEPSQRSRSWPEWLLIVLGALTVGGWIAFGLVSCVTPGPYPPQVPTRTPGAVPKGTPTPRPVVIRQTTAGQAELLFESADQVGLRVGRDNLILATLVWEAEGEPLDRSLPVLELALRGLSSSPCLRRPCGKDAGLVVRWSSNLKFDDTLDWSTEEAGRVSLGKSCEGPGTNYHERLALGPLEGGALRIRVKWDANQLSVATPAETSVWSLRRPRSFGLGQVIAGAPWPRGRTQRGWLWQDHQSGLAVRVLAWDVADAVHVRTKCP